MTNNAPVTLIMQLFGPMQSWGISSRWSERDTLLEPSKSGVVGILAAALGRPRDASVDDLAALRMGVRVDLEGIPAVDFQTAGAGDSSAGIAKAGDKEPSLRDAWARLEGTKPLQRQGSSISNRYHLQDAAFLVALQGTDPAFLQQLDTALRAPVFPIGLGRRGYVPAIPVAMPPDRGIVHGDLHDAFASVPWLPEQDQFGMKNLYSRVRQHLRTVIESTDGTAAAIRMDQPIGAAFLTRQFGPRSVSFGSVPVQRIVRKETSHDLCQNRNEPTIPVSIEAEPNESHSDAEHEQ